MFLQLLLDIKTKCEDEEFTLIAVTIYNLQKLNELMCV